jgi:hypothetical protein
MNFRNSIQQFKSGPSRRQLRQAITGTVLLLALSFAATGCSSQGVSLSPKDVNIPACTNQAPVSVINIGKHKRYTCDFAGIDIVFPDGTHRHAPAIGAAEGFDNPHTAGQKLPSYDLSNLGVYGIVADEVSADGKHTTWWGTPAGLAKTWAAFGKSAASIEKG